MALSLRKLKKGWSLKGRSKRGKYVWIETYSKKDALRHKKRLGG